MIYLLAALVAALVAALTGFGIGVLPGAITNRHTGWTLTGLASIAAGATLAFAAL
jgi:hypothetical protein